MANYDFNKDIEIGEEGEMIVASDLILVGGELISDNKNNSYDLVMNMPNRKGGKKITTYEIKTDVFCRPDLDTGNIFVEFESRNKSSGVVVSKADWFVNYFKHFREIWYIKTDELRELIKSNNFKTTEFSGDLNSNTKGYLIPRYQFKKYFIVRKIKKK